jgi:hypothetical protein
MQRTSRSVSLLLVSALALPHVVACQDSSREAPPPAVDDTRGDHSARPAPAAERPRMSTKSKVVILAGAAALYYLYKHHKNAAQAQGEEGQYYLSKNGRVYYRDAEHRAHWVTAPPSGIAVPESEAAEYREFQGYDNRATGRDLSGLAADGQQ